MDIKFSLWALSALVMACIITLSPLLSSSAIAAEANAKVLIVYYSRTGNTRALAEQIRAATGGELVELEPVEAYPQDYQATVDRARQEQSSSRWPQLKNDFRTVASYDVILLGSPSWGSTIAPPARTFLLENDLSGKTVALFMTHGGSGLGRAPADVKALAPQATVADGLAVSGRRAHDARDEVASWLSKIGLALKTGR